jgi:sugar phosphate isomerase/epimerase
MPGILKRLDEIERKLDACLVLLKMATTHDDFIYRLDDKSERWIRAMKEAGKIANASIASVIRFHQEYGTGDDEGSLRNGLHPWGDKAPTETEENTS